MKNQAVIKGEGNIFFIALSMVVRAMLVTAAALVLLALFMAYGNISDEAAGACTLAATLISVFSAGFMCGRRRSRSGWLSGLLAGALYVLVMLVAGFVLFGSLRISGETVKMFLICILGSITGGIFGVNFRKKRK